MPGGPEDGGARGIVVVVLLFLLVVGFVVAFVVGRGGGSPGPPYSEADRQRFDAAWTALLEYLAAEHPELDLALAEPASEDAIAVFEAAVGRELPGDVRELYRRADGQDGRGFNLFPGYRFLPLAHVEDQWRLMRDLRLRLFSFIPTDADLGVRPRWWHPGWLPMGENGAGDLLVVDRVPAAGGRDGQIVEFIHDDTGRARQATSVTELLEEIRTDLESGRLVPYFEWMNFVTPDQVD